VNEYTGVALTALSLFAIPYLALLWIIGRVIAKKISASNNVEGGLKGPRGQGPRICGWEPAGRTPTIPPP
jgi:hypothetical protein